MGKEGKVLALVHISYMPLLSRITTLNFPRTCIYLQLETLQVPGEYI